MHRPPSYSEVSGDHVLDDKLLQGLADMVGRDWSTLGVHLDMKASSLSRIRATVTVEVTMWPKEMLELWLKRTKKSPTDRYKDLLAALTRIHRVDLMQEVQQYFPQDSLDMSNDCTNTLRVIDYLSQRLTAQWKNLGIYLDIPSYELDKIEMSLSQPSSSRSLAFNVLQSWCQESTGTNLQRINQLRKALVDIYRNDIVLFLDRELSGFDIPCSPHGDVDMHQSSYPGHNNGPQTFPPPSYSSITFSTAPHAQESTQNQPRVTDPTEPPGPYIPQANSSSSLSQQNPIPSSVYTSVQPFDATSNSSIPPRGQNPSIHQSIPGSVRQPLPPQQHQQPPQQQPHPTTIQRTIPLHQTQGPGPSTVIAAMGQQSLHTAGNPSFDSYVSTTGQGPAQNGRGLNTSERPMEDIRYRVEQIHLANTMSDDMTDEGNTISFDLA